MRIAIAGIHIESSTFTRHVARLGDFEVLRGDELVANYPFEAWLGIDHEVTFVGALTANAGATGPIDPDVYDSFEDEMAERLAAIGPVDGVYLDMHGAMNVLGRSRAEEHWVRRVREVVGADAVISGSFDTHGNFSHELAELLDLAAFHRHAPHIDNELTRERSVTQLVDVIRRGERPAKAWLRLPALLPGERTSTVVEPGTSIFGRLLPAIDEYSLVDAAMCVGFFWADEERNAAAVFTTAYDPAAALAAAQNLGEAFWRDVDGFTIVTEHHGPWNEAI
ncbi:MAG: hypothetical protein JWR01_2520, partial [Subtercola sp.]|nr:hypothetical protein [Subtercola sp.]